MNDKSKPRPYHAAETVSTAIAEKPVHAVVSWRDKMVAITAQAAASEAPKGGFLSFKGGIMSYDETPIPNNKMEVVVIDFLLENAIFAEKYNANKPASPMCYAFGRDEKTMGPHENSSDPQSELCHNCPNNEWGSNPEGGRGKACKNSRRIAIMHADALRDGPDGVEKANTIMCKIPVTSIQNFSRYINQCTKVLGKPPFGVVCELSVKPSVNMFEVQWKVIDDVKSDELMEALYNKHVSIDRQLHQHYPANEQDAKPASKKY